MKCFFEVTAVSIKILTSTCNLHKSSQLRLALSKFLSRDYRQFYVIYASSV